MLSYDGVEVGGGWQVYAKRVIKKFGQTQQRVI